MPRVPSWYGLFLRTWISLHPQSNHDALPELKIAGGSHTGTFPLGKVPIGVCNAPGHFERVMLDEFVVVVLLRVEVVLIPPRRDASQVFRKLRLSVFVDLLRCGCV